MAITPEQKALARHRFERAEIVLNEAIDELSRNNYRLTNVTNFSIVSTAQGD